MAKVHAEAGKRSQRGKSSRSHTAGTVGAYMFDGMALPPDHAWLFFTCVAVVAERRKQRATNVFLFAFLKF